MQNRVVIANGLEPKQLALIIHLKHFTFQDSRETSCSFCVPQLNPIVLEIFLDIRLFKLDELRITPFGFTQLEFTTLLVQAEI